MTIKTAKVCPDNVHIGRTHKSPLTGRYFELCYSILIATKK